MIQHTYRIYHLHMHGENYIMYLSLIYVCDFLYGKSL
jgi:hypothetical protein